MLVVVLLGTLSACLGTRDNPQLVEHIEPPPTYATPSQATRALPDRWWEELGSGELNALVERALEQNLNLRAAWKRIEQAEAIGESIFLDLFPEELQREYWRLKRLREQGVIRSLLITSDEPWIPWELAKPFSDQTGEQDDFPAAASQVSRWLA